LSIRTGVFFMSEGENMNDGQFRKKKGFTAIQNAVAKNTDISLKAKGLYLLIQTFITMPGVSWKKRLSFRWWTVTSKEGIYFQARKQRH